MAVPAPSLVLLCVKSGATSSAAAELARTLPAGTPVVSMQNGVVQRRRRAGRGTGARRASPAWCRSTSPSWRPATTTAAPAVLARGTGRTRCCASGSLCSRKAACRCNCMPTRAAAVGQAAAQPEQRGQRAVGPAVARAADSARVPAVLGGADRRGARRAARRAASSRRSSPRCRRHVAERAAPADRRFPRAGGAHAAHRRQGAHQHGRRPRARPRDRDRRAVRRGGAPCAPPRHAPRRRTSASASWCARGRRIRAHAPAPNCAPRSACSAATAL